MAERVVRCRLGHVFTTNWVPLASVKAVRLGRERFQRCPVGRHWTLIRRVEPDSLTESERESARTHHDIRLI